MNYLFKTQGSKLLRYTLRTCSAYVEATLTASFRSYAAVTPQDWQTYEEMRSLAFDKHGLIIGAIDLPAQASDQSTPPSSYCLSEQTLEQSWHRYIYGQRLNLCACVSNAMCMSDIRRNLSARTVLTHLTYVTCHAVMLWFEWPAQQGNAPVLGAAAHPA